MAADLSDKCLIAALAAVAFWADKGADYVVPRLVPSADLAVQGLPHYRQIALTVGPLSPGILGLTTRGSNVAGIVWADIRVSPRCDQQTIAHELGHALGLKDALEGEELLMLKRQAHQPGWKLTPAEREFVQ